ncbi:MAG: peptidylprolyl isomerase [Polyangiaceae bacterium]|nr:peptidylprolyl isomerase [Myxococcales bacterium]MCB9584233.1 peptidylprolyl isomerase [Polyangiaceae bacterium]MCB9608604.1 peptidylprolyl isomerase [Polyangiaceae bacterium]
MRSLVFRLGLGALAVSLGTSVVGCDEAKKEPETKQPTIKKESTPGTNPSARAQLKLGGAKNLKGLLSRMNRPGQAPGGARKIAAKPVATVPVTPDDPAKGKFDLTDAAKGLKGEGYFKAAIDTTAGKLECELWHDKAPITVANFVGLARGLRPWKSSDGKWVKKPLYDGTPFHRVIKGFMIQGGDPNHNGSGGPGYVIPDEIWENAHHDERGLLCMANRGPNTNGSQFFIMDGVAAHLDGGYTIFGKCGPEEVIEKIANTKVVGDKAADPVKIKSVKITRDAKMPEPKQEAAAAPSGSAAASGAPSAAPSAAPAPSSK